MSDVQILIEGKTTIILDDAQGVSLTAEPSGDAVKPFKLSFVLGGSPVFTKNVSFVELSKINSVLQRLSSSLAVI